MVGDDARDDREAEAGSPSLRREVGKEELLAVARRNPAARVRDLDRDTARAIGEADFDLTARAARLQGVVDQVDQDALDLIRGVNGLSALGKRGALAALRDYLSRLRATLCRRFDGWAQWPWRRSGY